MRKILFRLLDPIAATRPIRRVLDAGCGTGYFARLLEQRYGWRVYPTDLSWEGLRCARRTGARRLLRADIGHLPLRAESFDAVLSLDVLVHLQKGQESGPLSEFARVLASRGLLVIRVAALDILRSRHSKFTHERQRFTRRRLIQLAEEHGFQVLRCTYANSLLMPVALGRFRIWEPVLRRPPASGTTPVAGWIDRLRRTAGGEGTQDGHPQVALVVPELILFELLLVGADRDRDCEWPKVVTGSNADAAGAAQRSRRKQGSQSRNDGLE